MGDFDSEFVEDVKIQSWSLYSVCMLFILLRIFTKLRRIGVLEKGRLCYDLAAGLYTTLIASLNVICQGGGSNMYPPEMAGTFSDVEIQDRIYGSKIVIVSEQAMLNVIYSIKACMLIMYTRLTLACFNISSDLLMLWVPIPLILKANVPWPQKAMLLSIFSFGGFVIVAAVLTKVFNLSSVWDPQYMLWYMREASVAIYVANIPVLWPVLRDWRSGHHGSRGRARAGESTLYRRKLGIFSSWSGGESRRGFRSWPGTACHSVMEHDMEMGLKDGGGGGGAEGGGSRGRDGSSSMERILTPLPPASLAPPPQSPAEVLVFAGPNTSEVRALETKDRTLAEFPGGGFCASAIHVQRTVEDRDQDAALDGRRGGTDVYNWEQNGGSNHRVGVYAGR